MNSKSFWMGILSIALIWSCKTQTKNQNLNLSPSGNIQVYFNVNTEGKPYYTVDFNDKKVIDTSFVGTFIGKEFSLEKGFSIDQVKKTEIRENWEMPWGEQREVQNQCNEVSYTLKNKNNNSLEISFKIFDDGIGFRYTIPKQSTADSLLILDEVTEFALTADHKTWWIPGDWDIYEHLYNETLFSEIDALSKQNHPNLGQTYIPENAVNTPVTQKSDEGYYLSFHEANLTNYAGMTLKVDKQNQKWVSKLVGSDILQAKAQVALPFQTPWRTIQITEKAGDLIESNILVNLNEPNKLGDISDYFSPMKYVGIWWEMHIGEATWDYEATLDPINPRKHGATTQNAKDYIDFAAENGFKGLLVEGWNTGWDKWLAGDREGIFDFITPYPDYNFDEVRDYAQSKGVQIIMHHETSSAPRTYEKQMDKAMDFMVDNGIHAVKTGYVGKIIPKGEYHHGQWMVNHYQKVIETAAEKRIAVNAHEPIKATGKRRTYPNEIAREGLRGQEFNAWASDGGNPPQHLPTVAFTRMLSGPIDFTPGAFNIKLKSYKEGQNQINTTLAQQLALYVVINSPLQMACDLPKHYYTEEGSLHPMFQFIKDVGVNWEQTQVLDGEIGEFVIIAREERNTGNWFVGGITGTKAHSQILDFSFLPKNTRYQATIYKDGEEAHWDRNPLAFAIEKMEIDSHTKITIPMAEGGGFAISLMKF